MSRIVIALITVISSVVGLFPTPIPAVDSVGTVFGARSLELFEAITGIESPRIAEPRVQTPAAPGSEARPDVEPMTESEQDLVDWARDRFVQAGLELPVVSVRFNPSGELCGTAEGLYHHSSDGERVVTICTRDSDTFGARLLRRRTLLHELGHAWDFANQTPDERDDVGRLLGADDWNNPDDIWADRGVERFAETFVFALLDQPARQLKVAVDCADLVAAFSAATGAQPLGPGLPPCAETAYPELAS